LGPAVNFVTYDLIREAPISISAGIGRSWYCGNTSDGPWLFSKVCPNHQSPVILQSTLHSLTSRQRRKMATSHELFGSQCPFLDVNDQRPKCYSWYRYCLLRNFTISST